MPDIQFAHSKSEQDTLARRARLGQLTRILPRVYAPADPDRAEHAVRRHWLEIVGFAYPDYILAFRSAITITPEKDCLYLVGPTRQQLKREVGPLTVRLLPGDTTAGVESCVPPVRRMTEPRVLLESLAGARAKRGREKFLTREEIEARFVSRLDAGGEDQLNALRDEARIYSQQAGLDAAFHDLDAMVGALLATGEKRALKTKAGRAHAAGAPYDPTCIVRCERFKDYLAGVKPGEAPFTYEKASWRHLAFFEAYFSNYIEGTEMMVEEAGQVAFQGKVLANRHGDSHDVAGTFAICSDLSEMMYRPATVEEFKEVLRNRHRIILRGRPDKAPGDWKVTPNQAGTTVFVDPNRVEGTLAAGFEISRTVAVGFHRALFLHFLVTYVHPMHDGNGRLARIMMNAELIGADEQKIIVPTVLREDYMNGQRHATRDATFRTICKVLYQVRHYTAALPATLLDELEFAWRRDGAFMAPDEGIRQFNSVRNRYQYPEPP